MGEETQTRRVFLCRQNSCTVQYIDFAKFRQKIVCTGRRSLNIADLVRKLKKKNLVMTEPYPPRVAFVILTTVLLMTLHNYVGIHSQKTKLFYSAYCRAHYVRLRAAAASRMRYGCSIRYQPKVTERRQEPRGHVISCKATPRPAPPACRLDVESHWIMIIWKK